MFVFVVYMTLLKVSPLFKCFFYNLIPNFRILCDRPTQNDSELLSGSVMINVSLFCLIFL